MSTVDLDAIRERYARYVDTPWDGEDGADLACDLAVEVPALLAEVEQLRRAVMDEMAERDAALAEVERLRALLGDDPRHVIEFRADGWTIKHPLACRPNLFECMVNRAAERDLVEAPGVLGRFYCDISEGGGRFLIGDSVGGAAREVSR